MAFFFTSLYIVLSLLSPGVLPDAIRELHVNEILSVFAIVSCLPGVARSRLGAVPDIYLLLSLLLASAIAMMLTGWIGGVLANFILFVPVVAAFPFVVISCGTLFRVKLFSAILAATGIFIFSRGLMAHLGNYSSPYILMQNVTDGTALDAVARFRGLGVLADPNDLGQFLVTVTPLLWLRWKKGAKAGNFFFTLVPAAILLTAVFYTHSRGAIVALLAILWFTFRKKLGVAASSVLAGLALLGMTALGMSGGRGLNDDDGGRVAAWSTGIELLRSHPLFGVGMGNFGNFNETGLTAHNSYILGLSEVGLIGYFCWMGMIVVSWLGLSRLIQLKGVPADTQAVDDPVQGKMASPRPAHLDPVAFGTPANAVPAYGTLAFSNPYQASARAFGAGSSASAKIPLALHLAGSSHVEERPSDEELAWAGRVAQIAMVGLLTTCFFLSRTYSMTLYVMLGIAASLRLIEGKSRGEFGLNFGALSKKIGIVVLASIVFLYLFVRLRGLQH